MVDRSVARRKALLDALMPLWQEREAALKIIAGKEIAAVRGLACEPPTAEERDRFERAQAAVERALQRLRWFDYRHVARPVRGPEPADWVAGRQGPERPGPERRQRRWRQAAGRGWLGALWEREWPEPGLG